MTFWPITANAVQCLNSSDGYSVSLAGRVVGFRRQGGIAFGHIVDNDGRIQFCFQKRTFERQEQFREWTDQIHLGDIIGIEGETWTSSTGEKTILVNRNFKLLQAAQLSFPDKLNGIVDPEARLRKRYLDCAINPEVKDVFRTRSKVIAFLRSYLGDKGFMEVETPILTPQASGAMASPFITHHNALNADLFLRIAPETYLKRAVAAGFDNVFEIGKNFRNEGIDPSHLQEFTSVEWYSAYKSATDNMVLFGKLMTRMSYELFGVKKEHEWSGSYWEAGDNMPGFLRSFNPRIVKYRDLFRNHVGQNPEMFTAQEADRLFKTQVRPTLIAPVFVTDYPAYMAPMAARKVGDPDTADMWQFICEGWEIVKCYTELTDPVLQRHLLEEQMQARTDGDEEAMMLEEDFLECMEHGMPPMSGLGMGIDRLICLITGQKTLRDVVLFPTLLTKKE